MFRIENGIYYSRIFFAEVTAGRMGNVMGAVYMEPGKPWSFTYRFRWYNDDRVYGSADDRSWYDATSSKPLAEVLEAARGMFAAAAGIAGEDGYSEVVIESDRAEDVFRALRAQPWAHLKELEPK